MNEKPALTASRVDVAAMCGCSVSNIDKMLESGKLKRAADGKVNVLSVTDYLREGRKASGNVLQMPLKVETGAEGKLDGDEPFDLAKSLELSRRDVFLETEKVALFGTGQAKIQACEMLKRWADEVTPLGAKKLGAVFKLRFTAPKVVDGDEMKENAG